MKTKNMDMYDKYKSRDNQKHYKSFLGMKSTSVTFLFAAKEKLITNVYIGNSDKNAWTGTWNIIDEITYYKRLNPLDKKPQRVYAQKKIRTVRTNLAGTQSQ